MKEKVEITDNNYIGLGEIIFKDRSLFINPIYGHYQLDHNSKYNIPAFEYYNKNRSELQPRQSCYHLMKTHSHILSNNMTLSSNTEDNAINLATKADNKTLRRMVGI